MLYLVDYLLKNKEEFEKSGVKVPKYIVANDFNGALELARKYESENTSLLEVKLLHADGYVFVSDKFKNVGEV